MSLFDWLLPCSVKRSWCFNSRADDDVVSYLKRTDTSSSFNCLLLRGCTKMGASASNHAAHAPAHVVHDAAEAPATSSVANVASANNFGIVRERKKKATGFATLRKKFIRRRRSSKTCDHARLLRELVADWSPLEVAALLEEYEALAAVKDLSVQAELARPPATTFKQDLSALYDYKYCTDADLIFRGACFPVHRAILSARCPYFRDLLSGCPGYGARICLEMNRSTQIDVNLFSALLRYLYTGDICPHDGNVDVLRRLGDEFGTPNLLEHDLRYLLETGDYSDAALVFTSDSNSDYQRPDSGSSEYGFRPKLELPCHKAILSARSPFFRNLIERRSRSGEEHTERALHIPTRIVLDESVIPKRYARALLHAVYLDTVDLSLILRGNGCSTSGSLGEVQALTSTGRMRLSPLEEAMELYQIGRFLELDILVQGCEDIILEWLTVNSLPSVLRWSSQAHGSAWVHRQAMHFLREEFHMIAQSPILYQLDRAHMINALESNFVQASELEILQAVIKWGEHELTKRMEEREPNLLNHTTHSVTRKGVKKRDLNDNELRELLVELLPLVRLDHILPPNSELLTQAVRRGLVSTPPSYMIGDERDNVRANAWIRTRNTTGLFVRPRFFMPYYEELKLLVEDQIVHDVQRLRVHRHLPDIPDTLYMIDDKPRANVEDAHADVAIPMPDPVVMCAMLKRVKKLKQSPICLRATESPLSSRVEINRQIRLRVVREFNLPDAVADLLDHAYVKYDEDEDDEMCSMNAIAMPLINTINSASINSAIGSHNATMATTMATINNAMHPINVDCLLEQQQQRACESSQSRNLTFPRLHNVLPAIVTEGELHVDEARSCSDGHLSQIMPDVAMATSSFGQLQLQEQRELELDLGDGTSHLVHGNIDHLDHIDRLEHPAHSGHSAHSSARVNTNHAHLNHTRASGNFVVDARAPERAACYRYMSNVSMNSMGYYNSAGSSSDSAQLKPNNFYLNPRFL